MLIRMLLRAVSPRLVSVCGSLLTLWSCGDRPQPMEPETPENPATRLTFVVSPNDGTAGAPLSPAVTVAVQSSNGTTITSATDPITIELINNTVGATLGGTLTLNAVDGVAAFTDLIVDKSAAGYALTASSASLTAATSSDFKIAAGPAAQLTFQNPPSDVDLDLPFDPAITVMAIDALGNIATDPVDVTITISDNPGQALLDGTSTVTTIAGVAAFADIRIDRVATGYTLTAATTGLAPVTSEAFDVRFAFRQLSGSVDVQFSQDHTCGVTTGGALYCWGSNFFGQLGNGDTGTDSDTPLRVLSDHAYATVAAGFGHTCAVSADGDAYCWGLNVAGQLGDGNAGTDSDTPVLVDGGHQFTTVVTGICYTCGLTTSDQALCWGVNDVGQLGNGNTGTNSAVPVPVSGGHAFVSMVGGGQHTCGLTSGGAAYCWGGNVYGQLGNGNGGDNGDIPVLVAGVHAYTTLAAGAYHTCGVTDDADAYCWGFNASGQLGDGDPDTDSDTPVRVLGGHRFSSLVAGTLHTCGITTSGNAMCWGDNTTGELGHGGNETERDEPVSVQGGHTFSNLASGSFHACGIAVDRRAYCWGWNEWGQLGIGSVGTDQPTPVIVTDP